MSEVLKKLRMNAAGFMAVGATVLTGCAGTEGHGVLTDRGVCVDQESTFKLGVGDKIKAGIDDISFDTQRAQDAVTFTYDGKKLKVEIPEGGDETELSISGVASAGDISVELSETGLEGKLTEDTTTVDFTARRTGEVASVSLEWVC